MLRVLRYKCSMLVQVALNKSNVLLKNILQNTQTLQPFATIIKTESNVINMPCCKALGEERPSGLIKGSGEAQVLKPRL